MASHATRVRADIDRWVAAGLIDASTGSVLSREIQAHDRKGLSFGTVLSVLAALLIGAAILIFVAANWEAVPRVARVLALFMVILAGYLGGALLKNAGHAAMGEAAWLVAAAAFGAGIALVGQMYHLSGDETTAVLFWCLGTAVAAAGLRSGVLTIAAAGLAAAWLFLRGVDFWRATDFPYLFPVLVAGIWAVSLWTRSQAARHLLVLSLVFYAVLAAADHDVVPGATLLALLAAGLFAFAVAAPELSERMLRLDGLLPGHALFAFLTGTAMIQLSSLDSGAFALVAAVVLAAIAVALLLAGRESRGLRWIAYVGFAVELMLIYGIMVGTMLDTATFFLAAGLMLGVLAFGIIRVERRMRPAEARR